MNPFLMRLLVKSLSLIFWVSCFVSFPTVTARADMGIKPRMEFKFAGQDPQQTLSIQETTLYECEQADCSDAQAIQSIGPQQLYCEGENCSISFYDFQPYYQLEVKFEDGRTLRSQTFAPYGLHSYYLVTVGESDLVVERRLAFDLLSAPICLSVCGSLGIAMFALLFLVLGLNKR